jgi:uncharacterized protein (TIGR03032 family)
VANLPGYARGLALIDNFAFVGVSKIRETSVFGGLPIAEQRQPLRCGVGVIELSSGRHVAHFEFESGVDEIFDVQLLCGVCWPAITGPFPIEDGGHDVWVVPSPEQAGKP